MSNYATKNNLKNSAGVDTSDFVKKADLASLKSDVEKIDIDTLEKVPSGLNTLKSKVDNLDVNKLKTVPIDFLKKRCS